MTSLEWQGAGLQHVVRSCWLCPLSHGTTKDMPPGDRAPGKRTQLARCPARPHAVSLHSGYRLGGAEHRDRHQLKPGNEALEVASCHPSRRHGIRGRTACSRALGTAGEGELKTGTTKGAGEALGMARTAAAQHRAHPPPPPPPLSFQVSPHLLLIPASKALPPTPQSHPPLLSLCSPAIGDVLPEWDHANLQHPKTPRWTQKDTESRHVPGRACSPPRHASSLTQCGAVTPGTAPRFLFPAGL